MNDGVAIIHLKEEYALNLFEENRSSSRIMQLPCLRTVVREEGNSEGSMIVEERIDR